MSFLQNTSKLQWIIIYSTDFWRNLYSQDCTDSRGNCTDLLLLSKPTLSLNRTLLSVVCTFMWNSHKKDYCYSNHVPMWQRKPHTYTKLVRSEGLMTATRWEGN